MQEEQIQQPQQPTSVTNPQTPDPIAPAPAAPSAPAVAQYAGFWIRLVAVLIDGIILGIISGIVQAVFGGVFGVALLTGPQEPSPTTAGLFVGIFGAMVFIIVAIDIVYYVGLTATYGATVGKRVLGLKVVDTNGQKIGFGKAALREVIGKWISGLVFGLGYLWVAFDEKKQGWHDKIAQTYVVKIR